jgi:hypothetical protein
MHRKITRFAFAGKCGDFGLSGFVGATGFALAACSWAIAANARYPNPEAVVCRR